jgi:proliferating cell nuclear antigen
MFEAKLAQAAVLKKILDAIKDLVTDANFDCSSSGISLQAMDSSHVSLIHLMLKAGGFAKYRCDRAISLGINLDAMSKILKCAGNDDVVTIKAGEDDDSVTFVFESPKHDKMSEFQLKLLDINSDRLGIPDVKYQCAVSMSAAEFQRICRDLTILGTDSVTIDATKGSVKFSVSGDLGSGNITCLQNTDVDSDSDQATIIDLKEPVSLGFALRYLNSFAKATALSGAVSLSMSSDVPLVVEYTMEDLGSLRFYLAPKIGDA